MYVFPAALRNLTGQGISYAAVIMVMRAFAFCQTAYQSGSVARFGMYMDFFRLTALQHGFIAACAVNVSRVFFLSAHSCPDSLVAGIRMRMAFDTIHTAHKAYHFSVACIGMHMRASAFFSSAGKNRHIAGVCMHMAGSFCLTAEENGTIARIRMEVSRVFFLSAGIDSGVAGFCMHMALTFRLPAGQHVGIAVFPMHMTRAFFQAAAGNI